jgi:hypothetical protein
MVKSSTGDIKAHLKRLMGKDRWLREEPEVRIQESE